MLFNSWQYIVFLPTIFLIYNLLPHKFRWCLLLVASYYFYMSWNANLIVLILTTTITSYVSALQIEKATNAIVKKRWLFFACAVSLGMLFFFKYFNFFSQSVATFLNSISLPMGDFTINVMLPVGISFYTFQTLSYVIDVYNSKMQAERHLGIFSLYVSFFPQLVAGPIERAENLLPQFHKKQTVTPAALTWGLRMIVYGLVKKMFIADYFAGFANIVFNDVYSHSPMSILIASMFFAVQIYCDFSGYSDIARGSAKLFGYDLMLNFKTPYLSKSIREFWARWHISLSSFLKDYVYIPLGGSRKGERAKAINLLITFLISGLWHGAAWTFVLWGLYHAIAQLIEDKSEKLRNKIKRKLKINEQLKIYMVFRVIFIFFVVCVGWILFRANTIADAAFMLSQLPKAVANPFVNLKQTMLTLGVGASELARVALSLFILFFYDSLLYKKKEPFTVLSAQKFYIRYSISYIIAFIAIIAFLTAPSGTVAEFIYFQF